MRCSRCGRELISWDWLVKKNRRRPVCHGGYDCYKRQHPLISSRMIKVREIAVRFHQFVS